MPESLTPPVAARGSILRPSVAYAALYMAVGSYFPYIAIFLSSNGLSLSLVGLFMSLSAAVGLVAAPAWGLIADHARNIHRPFLIGALLTAAAATLLSVAREPLALGVGIVLLSAGSAGLGPMVDSRTLQLMGADRDRFARARAWGSISFIVGSIAVGALIARFGVPSMFWAYVPLILMTAAAVWLLLRGKLREHDPARANPLRALPSILRQPTLGLFFVGSTMVWATVFAVVTFISIHALALGGGGEVVGLLWALGAFVEIPLMFAFPMLSRRVGAERLMVLGALAFAARSLAWAFVGDPLLLLVVAPLGGIGFALFHVGTISYVARAVRFDVRTTALGLFTGTGFLLGQILGSLVGGQLASLLTLRGLFAGAAFTTLAAAGLVWWAVASGRARGSAAAVRAVAPDAEPAPH